MVNKETKENHYHCRCMNLGGQCPNRHYADCDLCETNGNDLRKSEMVNKEPWEERANVELVEYSFIWSKIGEELNPVLVFFIKDLIQQEREKMIIWATKKIPCANCKNPTDMTQCDFDCKKDEEDTYCSEQCKYEAETGRPGEEY